MSDVERPTLDPFKASSEMHIERPTLDAATTQH